MSDTLNPTPETDNVDEFAMQVIYLREQLKIEYPHIPLDRLNSTLEDLLIEACESSKAGNPFETPDFLDKLETRMAKETA